ncbi:MAG: glycosyltransferase family 39 protein, partial [Thermodesulfobacteriota bacterium]
MSNKKFALDIYTALLLLLILSTSLFRIYYIQWGPLDLAPDEAHYWEWSRRLDLSYYSKGPVIAYIIALFTATVGNTELGVRIGAVILSAAITVLFFYFTKELSGSRRAAFFSALVPNITPLFSAGSILMTTDTPTIFFWALAVLSFYKAINDDRFFHWGLLGTFTALGMLTKYTMGVIYPSILLFLLLSKDDRHWLRRKEPYLAFLISLLCFMPEVAWNIKHEWVTFKHVLGQTHVKRGLTINLNDFLGFFAAQFGIMSPFVFIGVIYGMYRSAIDGFRGKRARLLLFFTSAPILAFFLTKALQAKVEANWASTAYYSGIVAGVISIDNLIRRRADEGKGAPLVKVFVVITVLTSLIITGIAHYPHILRHFGINLRKTPIMKLQGWKEAGERVGAVYEETSRRGRTFILSDRYQIASELAFYVPGHPRIYNINLGRRMNQYDVWEGFYSLKGWNVVYVEWQPGPLNVTVQKLFDSCEAEPPFNIVRQGNVIRRFYIYRCYGFKGIEEP